jgi:hypothetical protein
VPSPFARPDRASPSRKGLIAGAAAVVGAIAIAATLFFTKQDATSAYQKSPCSSETTLTCLVSWTRTPTGGTAVFNRPAGRELRYRIGKATDVMMTGNWFCGLGETLAVYRPSTGVVYYLPSWPLDTAKLDQPVLADLTGLKNRRVGIGDRNGDRCADMGLTDANNATWFLPAIQRARLVPLPIDITFESGVVK